MKWILIKIKLDEKEKDNISVYNKLDGERTFDRNPFVNWFMYWFVIWKQNNDSHIIKDWETIITNSFERGGLIFIDEAVSLENTPAIKLLQKKIISFSKIKKQKIKAKNIELYTFLAKKENSYLQMTINHFDKKIFRNYFSLYERINEIVVLDFMNNNSNNYSFNHYIITGKEKRHMILFSQDDLKDLSRYRYYLYMNYGKDKKIEDNNIIEIEGIDKYKSCVDQIKNDSNYLLQNRNDELFSEVKFRVFQMYGIDSVSQICSKVTSCMCMSNKGGSFSFILDKKMHFLYTKFRAKLERENWIPVIDQKIFKITQPNFYNEGEGISEIFDDHFKGFDKFQMLEYLFFTKNKKEIQSHTQYTKLTPYHILEIEIAIDALFGDFSTLYQYPFNSSAHCDYIAIGFENGTIIIKDERKYKKSEYKYKLYAFNADYNPKWDSVFIDYISRLDIILQNKS